jgi:hypothetical protein
MTGPFSDADFWDELAARYVPHDRLPGWDTPCHPAAMRRWLKRLGISKRVWEQTTATRLEEFIRFNPGWGLRAWIGLALEIRAAMDSETETPGCHRA